MLAREHPQLSCCKTYGDLLRRSTTTITRSGDEVWFPLDCPDCEDVDDLDKELIKHGIVRDHRLKAERGRPKYSHHLTFAPFKFLEYSRARGHLRRVCSVLTSGLLEGFREQFLLIRVISRSHERAMTQVGRYRGGTEHEIRLWVRRLALQGRSAAAR
jgi:hypothetical protein